MMQKEEIQRRRIRGKCRRGMLELDILLLNFFERHYNHLTSEEQDLFETILDSDDVQIYDWLMYADEPETEALKNLINKIAINK